jgi:hypothetical protein
MGDEADCDPNHGEASHCTRFAQIVGRARLTRLDTIGPALDAVQFRSLRMWRQEGPP